MTPVPSDSLSMWSPVENVRPIHACYTAVLAYEMVAPSCKWSVVSHLLHMLILCLGHWYTYFEHERNTDRHRIVCLHCSVYAWVFTCLPNPSWLSRVICTHPDLRKCRGALMVLCTYVSRSTSFMCTSSSSVCGPTLATPTNVAHKYTLPQLFLSACALLPHIRTYTKGTVWRMYVVILCLTTWQAYCVWQACTVHTYVCKQYVWKGPFVVCTVYVHSCSLLSLACDGCPQRSIVLCSASVLSSLLPIQSFFPLTTQAQWGMSLCYVRFVRVNALSLFSF